MLKGLLLTTVTQHQLTETSSDCCAFAAVFHVQVLIRGTFDMEYRLFHISKAIVTSSEAMEHSGRKNSLEQTKVGLNGDNIRDNIIKETTVMSDIS